MGFLLTHGQFQGKARKSRCKLVKLKMMTIEAQDSSTTGTALRISIFLVLVVSVKANEQDSALDSVA